MTTLAPPRPASFIAVLTPAARRSPRSHDGSRPQMEVRPMQLTALFEPTLEDRADLGTIPCRDRDAEL